MLGNRSRAEEGDRLARFAQETGRPKSAIARQWIVERLDPEAVDHLIRNAALLDAEARQPPMEVARNDATGAWLRMLNAEDGGYDWGPTGPPA